MHLLKLEWLKYRKNSVFLWMIGLYSVFLPLSLLTSQNLFANAPNMSADKLLQFPIIWSFLGYVGNWLSYFFFGFLAIYTVTSEFNNRTLRQNIISGLSRTQFISAKFLALGTLALLVTLYFALLCIVVGMITTDAIGGDLIGQRIDMIGRYFLMHLGYMSLGLIIALLARRTAMAVFFYFAYTLFFETIWRWTLHRRIFEDVSMHFYPANAFEDLAPIPFEDWPMFGQFLNSTELTLFLSPLQAVTCSVIYILLFISACKL